MTRLHADDLLPRDEMTTVVPDEIVQAPRIPVSREGSLCGYVARGAKPSVAATFKYRSALPGDVWMQLQLTHPLRRECWVDSKRVGADVKNSVVVDSMRGVLALRRIAAAIPGTTAIIDDLWMPCE